MKKIVCFFGPQTPVYARMNAETREYARSKGLEYVWCPMDPFDHERFLHELKHADAGIIDHEHYGEEVFSQVHETARLFIRYGVGFDQVDLKAASKYGVAVARTTASNKEAVAEIAMSMILSCRRQFSYHAGCVARGAWNEKLISNETVGSTVGVVGFGAIGRILAQYMKALKCTVLVYDPTLTAEEAAKLGVVPMGLEELVSTSDAISIHAPYSKETHHLFNAELLSKMKPEAVLVNTARGNIVDEDALYEALSTRRIRAAALDVFAEEPLPLTSPLLKLDNLLMTPHVSSATVEASLNTYKMAVDIAHEFFTTGGSSHILNPDFKSQG